MRRVMLVSGMVLAMFGSATAAPYTKVKGECLFEVGKKTEVDGPCNIYIGDHGQFEIGGDRAGAIRIMVDIDEDHVATGYWNGEEHASHAHDGLGTLIRDGGCWSNATAKVCAWRPGTRPHPVP